MSVVVAVTGAAGFVAGRHTRCFTHQCQGELIHQLLERGYTVRGTVRSKERATAVQEAFPQLILYEADLLKEGSFDDCFQGVEYVFHTASPFLNAFEDPQRDLVLASVEKNLSTIKKVVVTSSAAAIVHQHPPEDKEKVWGEEDWNTTSSLTEGPYRYSKYLAEKAAWDWWKGKEDQVKLLTVNPCFVLGVPRHKRADGVSITTMVNLLNGKTKEAGCGVNCFGIADNRNVAQTHIACVENENASGRHLVSSTVGVPFLEYAQVLREKYPDYPLPDKQNGEVAYVPKYSQEKTSRELGVTFYPYQESILWMAEGIIAMGYLEQ